MQKYIIMKIAIFEPPSSYHSLSGEIKNVKLSCFEKKIGACEITFRHILSPHVTLRVLAYTSLFLRIVTYLLHDP